MTDTEGEKLRDLYRSAYVRRFEREQSHRRIERLLPLMALEATDRVADFGCGSGLLVPYVAPRVREYVGVDFSAEFIEASHRNLGRQPHANVRFVCASIQDFARAHRSCFDAGFALDFAEHVPDAPWLEMLTAMRQTLRPDGRFFLHTPNAAFFLERLKARNFIVRQFPEHVAVRDPQDNIRLATSAGFRLERCVLLPHYNVLRWVHPLSRLPGMRRLISARIFLELRA